MLSFSKKDKQNLTSVSSFFVFSKEETQKTKNEIPLPFYRFSIYVQRNTKKGKTKNDFRFIVFPFMYEKTKKRKNKNRLPFYLFSFFVRTNTKNGKTTNDFLFIVFPFILLSCFYVLKQTKTYKRKLTSVLSFFFVSTTNPCKKRAGYNLIFRFFFFSFSLAV